MDKRRFLQALFIAGGVSLTTRPPKNPLEFSPYAHRHADADSLDALPDTANDSTALSELQARIVEEVDLGTVETLSEPEPDLAPGFQHKEQELDVSLMDDNTVDNYLARIRHFDHDFETDIHLNHEQPQLLATTLARLERLQTYVGHGNFNLLGFDEMTFFARNYEEIGAFTVQELAFMDEIFHVDATAYGFFGDKVMDRMTSRISMKDVVKIPDSGHYLFRGPSLALYEQILRDVGSSLLLTSGVRNIVKQTHLFLAKVSQTGGNLSRASRSVAPPGYSFHGIGDFDVGKIGLGERNFTSHFSKTEEFQRMMRLGYVDIRYTETNRDGVRYEPWHIKIV